MSVAREAEETKLGSECYLNTILDLNLGSDYGDDDRLLLSSCFYTHICI